MRTRVTVAILGIIVIGLSLLWVLRPTQSHLQTIGPGEDKKMPKSADSLMLRMKQQSSTVQTTASREAEPTSLEQAAQDALEQWKQRMHRPIAFYGRVVDENGRPVEGASVSFSYNRFIPPEDSFTTNTVSDRNGMFSLSGVMGSTLSVHVGKQGYYSVGSANKNHFNYMADHMELSGYEPFSPDTGNPVIFHLRKKGSGVELVTSQHGMSPDLEISAGYDGVPVRVNFFSRKVGSEGQLELSAVKPRRGETASQWSFRMSIPDGGFIEENDEFPFEAPESGYQSIVEFSFKAGETNWVETVSKDYYIIFGQPPKYGRIHIETGIYWGFRLQYAINPNGSRNLEPKEPEPPRRELPPGVIEVIPDRIKK
jgi:carboxypeptidase family protein